MFLVLSNCNFPFAFERPCSFKLWCGSFFQHSMFECPLKFDCETSFKKTMLMSLYKSMSKGPFKLDVLPSFKKYLNMSFTYKFPTCFSVSTLEVLPISVLKFPLTFDLYTPFKHRILNVLIIINLLSLL